MTAKTASETRYPEVVTQTMVDEAARIAQVITGTFDWHGCAMCHGQPGLVCMVQEHLDSDRDLKICRFMAIEDDGMYWVGYKS